MQSMSDKNTSFKHDKLRRKPQMLPIYYDTVTREILLVSIEFYFIQKIVLSNFLGASNFFRGLLPQKGDFRGPSLSKSPLWGPVP
jgi:hypothetical protein